jgi:hypothetical protein
MQGVAAVEDEQKVELLRVDLAVYLPGGRCPS